MYRFKRTNIQPTLDISDIMGSTVGPEGRFKSRFSKYAGTSETFIKSADLAGQAINDLRTSAGMISEQKKGIDRMFLLSEKAVKGIEHLEQESGVHLVDNIPAPTDMIRGSYGKKMGYVSLSVGFLSEGLLHFMEEVINLQSALESRDKIISSLAAQVPQLEMIGAFEDVSLSDLQNAPSVDIPTYTKSEKSTSSPTVSGNKKIKK